MEHIEHIRKVMRMGIPHAVLTTVKTVASTPRKSGSSMVVSANGVTTGTIGGGVVENSSVDTALFMLEKGETTSLVEFNLKSSGLLRTGEIPVLEEGKLRRTDAICGGDVAVFIQCFYPPERLILAGGGHIASAIHKIVEDMDLALTIVDNRQEYACGERFPGATVLCGDYRELFSSIPLNSPTYVVIITHQHRDDLIVLESLLERDWANVKYVGMIGSSRKVSININKCINKGYDTGKIAQIRSPVGLCIGGNSPPEIAISIMAEITAIKHGKNLDNLGTLSIVKELVNQKDML